MSDFTILEITDSSILSEESNKRRYIDEDEVKKGETSSLKKFKDVSFIFQNVLTTTIDIL